MIVDYIGSIDTKHEVTKYTLSTGTEVLLTEDEATELCAYIDQIRYANQVEALECEIQSLDEENADLTEENEDLLKQIKALQEEILKLK